MPLAPGTRLGPYEILARIGAGGMGEVYRAHDQRLARDVAVKILSAAGSQQRLDIEARALASLKHPNIVSVYDTGAVNGAHFIVSELVDGEPLARTRLSSSKALQLAAQIAEGLAAAHEAGIVHRDLKPSNVMVTRSGRAKILDFGLATVTAPAGPAENIPTVTLTGAVMGTPEYMSPEQVRGEAIDHRSDIFSFGILLHEMLSGNRPFSGSSAPETMVAILKESPAALPASVPAALRRIVSRCLEKDPRERWHSATDIVWLLKEFSSGDGQLPVKPRRRVIIWLSAAAALAITAAAFLVPSRRAEPAGQPVRFVVFPLEGTNFTDPAQFALSPDGRAIAFVASAAAEKPTLWVRRMDEIAPRQFAGTDDVSFPFWSPDGNWIGFFAEGKIKKIPAKGGLAQVVGEIPSSPRGGTWGPDGTILFGTIRGAVNRIAAAAGPVTQVTHLDASRQESSHRWPMFLPDGRHFLYQIRSANTGRFGVYVGSLDGENTKLVMPSNWNGVYAPQGYLLYRAGVALMGVKFRTDRLQVEGEPFIVAEHVENNAFGMPAVSVSATGALAYALPNLRASRLTWFDRSGNRLESVGPEGSYLDLRLSPDERRLAVTYAGPKVGVGIRLTDLARGVSTPFTLGGTTQNPIWSPDGTRIAFRSMRANKAEFYLKSAAGGGSEEPIFPADAQSVHTESPVATDWSPDGRQLLYSTLTPAFGWDLWLLPVTGDRTPVAYLSAPSDQMHGAFSPDGRLIAYSSNESGRFEVYVQTFPISDRKWQISVNGGYEPRWRRDGREIYFLSADGKLMAASVNSAKQFEAGVPKALFQTPLRTEPAPFAWTYDASSDGQRFLVKTPSAGTGLAPITIVLNWMAGVKK